MTTTGELSAIVEELELVDIGDAASYLGEETEVVEESQVSDQAALMFAGTTGDITTSECTSCQMY
jgi:hypothetical protein